VSWWYDKTKFKNSDDNKIRNDFKMYVFKQRDHFYEDTNLK